MDRLTPDRRSLLMSKVRSKDTKPEMAVRTYLHGRGLRYRLHDKALPGKPDLVFRSKGAVVLVHGCFWHGHGCSKGRLPKSRLDFWGQKIQGNMVRDQRNIRRLRSLGWRVYVVWQCQICERRLDRLFTQIVGK
jgi:DNA mismatch endonuclease (patch repair protein)